MPTEDAGLPPFPVAPPGVPRMQHLPTVEASLEYWEAVRARAIRSLNRRLERTAAGLRYSYEAARAALKREEPPPRPSRGKSRT
jgi:hypothetical protein